MAKKRQLSATIDGREYVVMYRRLGSHGACDPVTYPPPLRIRLDTNLKKLDGDHHKNALIYTLHELTHASDWQKDEQAVVDFSEAVADVLWRLGWRRIPDLSEIG